MNAAISRFSCTVMAGKTPLPPKRIRIPRRALCSGVVYVMFLPLRRTTPARRRPEAGDGPENRGLARAVGAEQREHLAVTNLEPDIEEHLDRPVREVDVDDLQRGNRLRRFQAAFVFLHLFLELRRRPSTGRCG